MNCSYSFGIFYESDGEKYLIHSIVIPASSIAIATKKARDIEIALNNCWNAYRVRLLDVGGIPVAPDFVYSKLDFEIPF